MFTVIKSFFIKNLFRAIWSI